MKPIKGYKEATATNFSKMERLPVGGYVLKVLDVKEENHDWGDVVILRFDIAEGEQKGFFDKQYKAMSDEYKKWKGTYRINVPVQKSTSEEDVNKYKRSLGFFKSQIEAFNKSNANTNIDCSKEWNTSVLKNKLVGAVFGNKEWEMNGRSGWFTNCDHLIPVDDIRNDNFTIPKDKPLSRKESDKLDAEIDAIADSENFEVGVVEEGEVPF
ncbi:hypothetical protein [Porcipelethomonas sp.]|uniref:hypothetical protein n=1 Tax=Porcipelethomonas sp. TaxID=2981675 RepID=UPI003EF461BE